MSNTDTMGVYGNYYLKRAMVAQLGLGANLPEDAVYPLNIADATGKPLKDGCCASAGYPAKSVGFGKLIGDRIHKQQIGCLLRHHCHRTNLFIG